MITIRVTLGILSLLLALALMNVSSNSYTAILAVATGLGLMAVVALEGPARAAMGAGRWPATGLLGFAALVTLYCGAALVSVLISGE